MVVHVARAAVHLDRQIRVADRGLGGVQLGDRGLGGARLARVLEPAGLPHEPAGGLGVHHHVRDHRLHELECADRATELLALLRILNRRVHTTLRDPNAAGRDAVAA